MPLLSVKNLSVAYGELQAVRELSFSVDSGEVVTILGSNGAGKTTTLGCLAGQLHASNGAVSFAGRDITKTPSHEVAALGIALVPEGRHLFPRHTVRENLEVGAYRHLRRGRKADFLEDLDQIFELFPRIRERLDYEARLLSGGEQQMVAIARALVSRPRLLLLDEPSLGLSPILVDTLFTAVERLNSRGLTVLLVEQMARAGLSICDRALVLDRGKLVIAGTPQEVAADPRVLDAYLGTSIRAR